MVNMHFAADTSSLAWQPNHEFCDLPQSSDSQIYSRSCKARCQGGSPRV